MSNSQKLLSQLRLGTHQRQRTRHWIKASYQPFNHIYIYHTIPEKVAEPTYSMVLDVAMKPTSPPGHYQPGHVAGHLGTPPVLAAAV